MIFISKIRKYLCISMGWIKGQAKAKRKEDYKVKKKNT